ncbi:uncharacterized protein LOC111641485 [Centruroides sculpturatus]|uniref:uncharacterized protein LOC111641485 n=1 Tax=Centruroides sculpturatus TaxID=218467 RepID=UPI000C6E45C0|nr:uncharacterized protein LOC111641485 [Centruroides sculpturatus]
MELNDWNPMEEDYNSLSFNSYDRGRGQGIPIDRHPSWKNSGHSRTITLYVGKIPIQLNKKGLQLLFSKYGKVLRSYLCYPKHSETNTIYGFVDYATLKEAEMAIRELDGKPPLNLRVSFYKSFKERQEQQLIKEKEMNDYLEKSLSINSNLMRSGDDVAVVNEDLKVKGVGCGKIFLKNTTDGSLRNLPDFKITKNKNNSEVVVRYENPDNMKESNSVSPKASNNKKYKMQEFHNNRKTENNDFRRETCGKDGRLLPTSCGQSRGSLTSSGRGIKFSVSSTHNQLLSSLGQDNGFLLPLGRGKGFQTPLGRGRGFPALCGDDRFSVPFGRGKGFQTPVGGGNGFPASCEEGDGFSALSKTDSKQVQTPHEKNNKLSECSSSVNKENKMSLECINHTSNVYNQSCDNSCPYQSLQSANHNSLKQEEYTVNQGTNDIWKLESNNISKYHSTKEISHYQNNMMSSAEIKASRNGNQSCIKQENLNLNCKSKNNNEGHYLKHKSLHKDSFEKKLHTEKITDDNVTILKQKSENINQSSTQTCKNIAENQIKNEIIISENNKKIELQVQNKQDKGNSKFCGSRKKISLQKNKENCNWDDNYRYEQYEDISRPQKSESKKMVAGSSFETNEIRDSLQKSDIEENLTSNKKLDDCFNFQKMEAIKSEKKIQLENKDFQRVPLGSIRSLEPGMELEVYVLYRQTNTDFWIMPMIPAATETVEKINNRNKEPQILEKYDFEKEGRIVFAQFSDGSWYRAYITGKSDNGFNARFIDYGNEETVTEISSIFPEEVLLPSYSIHCLIEEKLSHENELRLKECIESEVFSVTVISCQEDKIHMKYKHSEDFSVTLVGYPWYHNIKIDYLDQTMISSLENLGIHKELHREEIYDYEIYDYSSISSVIKTLQVGCDIYLLITMCGGDMFSAMIGEVPVVEEILNLEKCLSDEYSCIDQCFNKYKLGDLVAAFSLVDNTWYRACIKKTFKESYLIYYVDYGKEEIVKTVHPLRKKYCSFPSPAICSKIGSISDDLQKPLRDLILPGNMMKAEVRACIRDKYYLDIMDFEGNEFICQVIAYSWNYGLFEIPDHLSDSAQSENMQQENVYINDESLDENRYKVISDTNSENSAKDEEIRNENKSLSESIISAERYENSLVQKIHENLTVTTVNKVKIDNMPRETVPSIVEMLHKEDEICLTIIHASPDKLEFRAINSNQNIVQALVEMRKSIEELTIDKNIKPQFGDVIAAQSVTDGKWYRAYILNEQNGNFRVRYIDYGNEEEIILFKILPLNLLKVISPLVYCTIEDSAEYIDKDKIKEMLVICKSLLGKVKYVDPNKIHITLLDGENKFLCNVIAFPWHHDLVPSQLTSVNHYQKSIQSIAKPAEDLTDIKICSMYEDMKKLLLSDIDNCKVQICSIVNLCKLFVQPVHLEMEIANLLSEISYFCENNSITSYVPKINEVVCAMFKDDGLWYRGLVVSSTSLTTFLVHFVDFGNDDEIECKYLRPIPEQFFKNFTYCVEVAIEGLPSILPTFNVQCRLKKEIWTLKVIDAENHIVKLLNSEGISLNEFLKN